MKKKIKVLHVVGAMNRAGTETMLMNIFRNIDRNIVHFDFVSYDSNDAHYDEEIKQLGGRIIKLKSTSSLKELIKAMKEFGPYDVVHSHTLFHCGIAIFAAMLAGIKVRISHAHTTLDQSDSVYRKLYISLSRRMVNQFSTHLLACSKEAGGYLFGNKGLTNKNYMYFPNLIDYSTFLTDNSNEVESFKEKEKLENSIVIGHIGRFIEPKNHRFLIEVVEQLINIDNRYKLLLVGDGDLREEIETLVDKKNLKNHVIFTGVRDDIHTMFQCMDIFVFPSKYEGLGLVMLEAQASGLPCLVSEAIQPEADLKIGLVTRLSLKDSAKLWASEIIRLTPKKLKDKRKIEQGFHDSGYVMSVGILKLMKIYQV